MTTAKLFSATPASWGSRASCEAEGLALSQRPLAALDQEQEPTASGGEARSRRGLGQREMAMTADGKNRIMIFGPKTDGTYIIEFRTAAGEALAISIPRTETAVVRYFQERMPYWAVRAGWDVHKE
jgi:hypothetical protein